MNVQGASKARGVNLDGALLSRSGTRVRPPFTRRHRTRHRRSAAARPVQGMTAEADVLNCGHDLQCARAVRIRYGSTTEIKPLRRRAAVRSSRSKVANRSAECPSNNLRARLACRRSSATNRRTITLVSTAITTWLAVLLPAPPPHPCQRGSLQIHPNRGSRPRHPAL